MFSNFGLFFVHGRNNFQIRGDIWKTLPLLKLNFHKLVLLYILHFVKD